MRNALPLITISLLTVAPAVAAESLVVARPASSYAATGLVAGGVDGSFFLCLFDPAPATARLTGPLPTAGGPGYALTYSLETGCGVFSDSCSGVAGRDGAVRGACGSGSFTLRNFATRRASDDPLTAAIVSFDLEVRGSLGLATRSPGLPEAIRYGARGTFSGAGVEFVSGE